MMHSASSSKSLISPNSTLYNSSHDDHPWLVTFRILKWSKNYLIKNISRQCSYSGVVQPSNVLISLGYVTMTVPVTGSWRGLADRVIINSNYDTAGHTNDVALIRLQHTVTFNSVIQAICLPDTNVNLNKFKVCVDTGYGLTLRSGTS